MKKNLFAFSAFILFNISTAFCQKSNPVEYMNVISEAHSNVTKEFLDYTSAVAHGKSARKVEKRRTELFGSLNAAKGRMKNLKPFENTDTSYKNASLEYFNLCYIVLKEDYGKILDMEEIAEQSYDNYEAYLMAQDLASDKLSQAGERVDIAEKQFAANHNVNLISKKSELSIKAEKMDKVSDYYHKVYLVFFKSYKQESYLLASIEEKNINGIEQNNNSLEKFSAEGLTKLDSSKTFNGDASLFLACKKMLQFYQKESKEKTPLIVDFLLKNEKMNKMKEAMDKKKPADRTKEDIDNYNKAINDFNTSIGIYNKNNKEVTESRNKLISEWNNASADFLNKQMPVSK